MKTLLTHAAIVVSIDHCRLRDIGAQKS